MNKVKLINQISLLDKEFAKFSEDFIKLNNPVGAYKSQKKQKKKDLRNFFNFLSNFIDEFPNLNYISDFNFNMKFSIALDEPDKYFKLIDIEQLEVFGSLRTTDYNKFKDFYDEIQSDQYIFKLKEIETTDIPINFTNPFVCQVCKKEIPNDKECFYCYKCIQYYCYQCIKKHFQSNTGINKFIDKKHNLLFFKTREIKNFLNLDSHKFGKNAFTKCSNFKKYHSASCDGCSSDFYNSQRFVCITCHPGLYLSGGYCDYCNSCVEHMMAKDEKGKQMQQKESFLKYNYATFTRNHSLVDRHNHENHIYLMVALEGIISGYTDF